MEFLWANLKGKGGELANFAGDRVAEVADQTQRGIQRVCDSDSLVVGFLAHTGLSLDKEPSPQSERINKRDGHRPRLSTEPELARADVLAWAVGGGVIGGR